MDRDLSKTTFEMKFPLKIPDESGVGLNKPDESLGITDDSDERRVNSIQQFLIDWTKETKMFLSEQLSRTTLRFQKTLRSIEYEVAKNYESRRKCMYKKSESSKGDSKCGGPSEDIVQNCIRRYQELETVGKTQFFHTVDLPIDINQLSDLITYMSLTHYLDSDDVCSTIDSVSLHSVFKRFCVERENALGKLEELDADLHSSLSEVIVYFKLLMEYFMRDLFIITKRGPETVYERRPELFDERQEMNRRPKTFDECIEMNRRPETYDECIEMNRRPKTFDDCIEMNRRPETYDERRDMNRRLKSLNKLMMVYFKHLMEKMESLANKADSFHCQKTWINQNLLEFLNMDLCEVRCIEFKQLDEFQ